jgi:ABC-type transport system substrate-binding protein
MRDKSKPRTPGGRPNDLGKPHTTASARRRLAAAERGGDHAVHPGPARRRGRQALTVGTNIPFTTLDPNTINTSVFPFRNSVFDGLIQIPVMDIPTYKLGSIQNELASAVNVNADYTEIRMRVRDGVKFHDGAPMTVGDVVESIRYALDTKTGGTMAGSLADIASLCFACSRRGILPTTPTRRWEPDRSASASMCPMTT